MLLGKVKEKEVLTILSQFKILTVTKKDAILAAKIFKDLKRQGKLINTEDIIVAAQAINRNLIMITKDRDFTRIQGLKIILIQ